MFKHFYSISYKQMLCCKGLALFLLLGLISGCSLFGQGAEDSRPPAQLTAVTPQLTLKRLWKTGVGGQGEGLGLGLRPLLKDEVLYVAGHNGVVNALNAKNGRLIWSRKTGLALSAGPGVGGSRVLVASNNGDVVALDIESGNELWRTVVSGEILAAPGVSPEQVAVRSANGNLHVLAANDGGVLWKDEQEVPRLSLRGHASPIVTNGVVLSASDSGKITSFKAVDGVLLWERMLGLPRGSTELERLVDIDGVMQLQGTDLYVVGYNARLGKVDARSGNIIWAKNYSSSTGVNLDWKQAYLSDADDHVVAVNQETGAEVWKTEDYQYRELSAPRAVGAAAVVVGDFEGFAHFLSPQDGSTLARVKVSGAPVRAQPVAQDNTVYIQADDGTIVAYSIN